jgi:hypothetical protein
MLALLPPDIAKVKVLSGLGTASPYSNRFHITTDQRLASAVAFPMLPWNNEVCVVSHRQVYWLTMSITDNLELACLWTGIATRDDNMETKIGDEIFHYTNLEALVGIVTKQTLWASDAQFLNDSTELKHAQGVCCRCLDLKQANAGGVRHGCFIEISDDTISGQR